jgi:Flp pilus assembly protein TadG
MRCSLSASQEGRRGVAIVLTTVMIVVLTAALGLAVDVGYLYFVKRQMQIAADAAAIAGALEAKWVSGAAITTAAREAAAANGFAHTVDGVTVTVNTPPTSGSWNGRSKFVEVLITKGENTYFLRAINRTFAIIQARGVAGPGPTQFCVFILDSAGGSALSLSGNSSLTSTCGVQVNSTSAQAISVGNAACLSAPVIHVKGNVSNSGCAINPPPKTGQDVQPDPFLYKVAPAVGACTATNLSINSSTVILNLLQRHPDRRRHGDL